MGITGGGVHSTVLKFHPNLLPSISTKILKMKKLRLWFLRTFYVIHTYKAKELNLIFIRNVYGDEINELGCRSIWKDSNGNEWRIIDLVY